MAAEPEEEEETVEEGAPAWMATYADLATLLLTFFVLLLSFANMDVQNFRSALGSVREALGVQFEHPGDKLGLTTSIVELSTRESTDRLNEVEIQLADLIRKFVKKENMADKVDVEVGNRGIIVRVKEFVLFDSGEADLRSEAAKPLQAIATLMKELELPVWIEGHTDNTPISTSRYPSNWELSAARAVAALRFLSAQGGIERTNLSVAGYAETHPISPNDTADGRARNRRVEFLFVRPPQQSVEQFQEFEARKERLRKLIEAKEEAAPPGGAPRPAAAARPEGQAAPGEPPAAPSAAQKGPIF